MENLKYQNNVTLWFGTAHVVKAASPHWTVFLGAKDIPSISVYNVHLQSSRLSSATVCFKEFNNYTSKREQMRIELYLLALFNMKI